MGKIVAIGGGEIRDMETLAIDAEIVGLTGKQGPRALFIPTASGDDADYYEAFRMVYGQELGCETDVLHLVDEAPTQAELKARIFAADLIYVGGGNALKMMRRWRRLGVDKVLRLAYKRGIVLSGISAGALCWFSFGHSDSRGYYNPDDWDFIRVSGLGLVKATYCPHLNDEGRHNSFVEMIEKRGGYGIGLDNNCALQIVDNQYRVLFSDDTAEAFKFYRYRGDAYWVQLEKMAAFKPLKELLSKSKRPVI